MIPEVVDAAEFEALEVVLLFSGEHPNAPQDPGAADRLWAALATIGWDRPAPEGRP